MKKTDALASVQCPRCRPNYGQVFDAATNGYKPCPVCPSALEYETATAIWKRILGSSKGIDTSVQLSVPNLATLYAERCLMRGLLRESLVMEQREKTAWRDAVNATLEAK